MGRFFQRSHFPQSFGVILAAIDVACLGGLARRQTTVRLPASS
jgi:hypothetical protein